MVYGTTFSPTQIMQKGKENDVFIYTRFFQLRNLCNVGHGLLLISS